MIANARMYSVAPLATAYWRELLSELIRRSGQEITVIDHAAPDSIETLWQRSDLGGVFMCGLPFSRSLPQPQLLAAPVPEGADFAGQPRYWSEFVVRQDNAARSIEDTFGSRIAFTEPHSQSGFAAAARFLSDYAANAPLYREVIAPRITPLGALKAVVEGRAEVAPIDAYAHRLLAKYRPELTAQVRIVARTAPTPIPVLVASQPGLESLTAELLGAHRDPVLQKLLGRLLLARFAPVEAADYAALAVDYSRMAQFWRSRPVASVVHPAFLV